MNYILIVFVKNPIQGKVKTRMAATIGNERAVEVYLELLNHTKSVITKWLEEPDVKVQKQVVIYYGDYINDEDLWIKPYFLKKLQVSHPNLGMRMQSAFEQELVSEADRVVIIGSDCLQLKTDTLEKAVALLESNSAVIGPASDGGYYLLGLTKFYPDLFIDKPWSTNKVFAKTIDDLINQGISYTLLEELNDIDDATDLEENGIPI